MKKAALLVALCVAMPGWAQDAKPPAQEEAKPAAPAAAPAAQPAAPAAQEAGQPAKKPVAKKAHPSRRQQDARHCLEKPTNTEIIKCAEAYL